jgi:uncharacterized protein YjbI with pentapeptide repeats
MQNHTDRHRANRTEANFSEVNLQLADFNDGFLNKANLKGTDITGAIFL